MRGFIKINRFLNIAPLLFWGAIIFCTLKPLNANAQNKSWANASIYASSLFRDTNSRFFDASSFSISYSQEIYDYVNGFIDLGTLTAIQTKSRANSGLDRFSVSLLNLNVGVDLILVEGGSYLFSIGVGGGLRKRKEVIPFASIQTDQEDNFTADKYIRTVDYGGLIQIKQAFKITPSILMGLLTRFHIYNEGDSVFDLGVTVGKQF